MGFFEFWLGCGLIVWATLWIYRLATDGWPSYGFKAYLSGFVLALIIGPIGLGFLIKSVLEDIYDQVNKRRK